MCPSDSAKTEDEWSLLLLLASIREAAGDPHGKLMQDELIDHIRGLRAAAEAASPMPLSQAVMDVLTEMRRQVEEEGFDAAHDDAHEAGELACAAASYLVGDVDPRADPPTIWPWGAEWWKPKGERRNLERGCALALKELERYDRAKAQEMKLRDAALNGPPVQSVHDRIEANSDGDIHDGRAVSAFAPGDRVVYVPMHAHGNRAHSDCERGRVSSVGADGTVFVRFDSSVARLGWDGATAQACYPDSLVKH